MKCQVSIKIDKNVVFNTNLAFIFFLILKKKVLKFSRAYMYEHRQGHLRCHLNFSLLHNLKYCQKYNILYIKDNGISNISPEFF